MTRSASPQRGVSLIEAVVALAVMAFGLLGVVGLQSSLRANADVSKQRSEAVRIAQQSVEQRRGFTVVPTTPARVAFDDIITQTSPAIVGTNATYTLTETVVDNADPRHKTLTTTVSWADRASVTQSITLNTVITAATPELSAALSVPAVGSPAQVPQAMTPNPGVPPGATDMGDGTSHWTPPGAPSGFTWVFSNATGQITEVCTPTCAGSPAWLLSGFVQFSDPTDPLPPNLPTQPTPADAANPSSTATLLDVTATPTTPIATPVPCFVALQPVTSPATPKYVSYACAVPVTIGQPWWSGSSLVGVLPANLATSIADPSATKFRVCRYTPVRDSHPGVPPLTNQQHPLNYVQVNTSLFNQNFLVIRAGDGTLPFTCPADLVTSPVNVNTNTWHHQPSA